MCVLSKCLPSCAPLILSPQTICTLVLFLLNLYVKDAITSTNHATVILCCYCMLALLLVNSYTGNVFHSPTLLCYEVVSSHSWVSLICMAWDTEWSLLILLLSAFLGHSIKSYRIAHCCLCNDSNKFKKHPPSPHHQVHFEFQEFPEKLHSAWLD